jgi:hypothetical protein
MLFALGYNLPRTILLEKIPCPTSIPVGPHFSPGLGLEDKSDPDSSFCGLVGEHKPSSSFETYLSHSVLGWLSKACLALPLPWALWLALSDTPYPFSPIPASYASYPTKNPPPYVPNLYKLEAEAIKVEFLLWQTPGPWCVCFGPWHSPSHSALERLGWTRLSPSPWACWQRVNTSHIPCWHPMLTFVLPWVLMCNWPPVSRRPCLLVHTYHLCFYGPSAPLCNPWALGALCFVFHSELSIYKFLTFCTFFFFPFFFFWDRVSLCSPDCPGTHSVDQAGLDLRNLPASASRVLGLKASATNARLILPDVGYHLTIISFFLERQNWKMEYSVGIMTKWSGIS